MILTLSIKVGEMKIEEGRVDRLYELRVVEESEEEQRGKVATYTLFLHG